MMATSKKLRLLVLFGGRSGEHEVSLMSARSVLSALDQEKYEIIPVGITHDGTWLAGENVLEAMQNAQISHLQQVTLLPNPFDSTLYALEVDRDTDSRRLKRIAEIDVVFPVLHGTLGEDGTLQGFMEMAGLPYVGAGVLGSAVGMDKGIFQDVMRAHSIPVLETMIVQRNDLKADLAVIMQQAELMAAYPLFVKPANLGSSVGVTKCLNRSDLMEGLLEAARYDRRVLIQRGIQPREIEVSVLGNANPQASVPGEIIPSRDFYSYEAKYLDGNSGLIIPAPLSAEMTARIQELAVRAYQIVDCAGMARVDFLLDKNTGELFLGEVNTIPGFTQISMYPKLWEASGLPYPALLDRLIMLALERRQENDQTEWSYHRGN